MLCQLGPITILKSLSSSFSAHFSRFPPIFTHSFPVFALRTNFCSFYASGFFTDPQFLLFLSFGLLVAPQVILLSSRGSGFGTQLPPKLGPKGKLSFWPLPLHQIKRRVFFGTPGTLPWTRKNKFYLFQETKWQLL